MKRRMDIKECGVYFVLVGFFGLKLNEFKFKSTPD